MEELMKLKSHLQSLYCGAKLTLEREDSAIPREIVLEDMKQYREEIEVIERAINILRRNKEYLG